MLRPIAPVIALIAVIAAGCGDGGGDPTPTLPRPTATVTLTRAESVCRATAQVAGAVASAELIEISGLAASRTHEGVLWAHNDSGDTARVFAMAADGAHLASITLAGVEAIDWEDMAIGPGPDQGIDYLYLADIGDNAAARPQVDIYRLPEPNPFAPVTTAIVELKLEKLTLLYPDRPHDAETLLVDPRTGDLIIVTKELQAPESFVFLAPGPFQAGATVTLELVTTIDFAALPSTVQPPADASVLVLNVPHLPTGGDVSPAGDLVVIRTYGTAWLWERAENSALWDAFAGIPCEPPTAIEEQGEAIAFTADGSGYVTISEGDAPTVNLFTAE